MIIVSIHEAARESSHPCIFLRNPAHGNEWQAAAARRSLYQTLRPARPTKTRWAAPTLSCCPFRSEETLLSPESLPPLGRVRLIQVMSHLALGELSSVYARAVVPQPYYQAAGGFLEADILPGTK